MRLPRRPNPQAKEFNTDFTDPGVHDPEAELGEEEEYPDGEEDDQGYGEGQGYGEDGGYGEEQEEEQERDEDTGVGEHSESKPSIAQAMLAQMESLLKQPDAEKRS